FDGQHHARGQHVVRVRPDGWGLVHLKPNAVAEAMGEIIPVARFGDESTGGGVHVLDGNARSCGSNGAGLGLQNDGIHLFQGGFNPPGGGAHWGTRPSATSGWGKGGPAPPNRPARRAPRPAGAGWVWGAPARGGPRPRRGGESPSRPRR